MVVYSYTPLIKVSDKSYPKYLSDFKRENPNVSIGTYIYSESLAEFGYMPVVAKNRPAGDVVTEGQPALNEETGEWEQTWDVRDYNQGELEEIFNTQKNDMLGKASSKYQEEMNSGVSFTSGDKTFDAQLTSDNMLFLLTLQALAGSGEESDTYTYESGGEVFDLTRDEVVDLATAVFKEHHSIKKAYWKLVSEINAATKKEELPAIPDTLRS